MINVLLAEDYLPDVRLVQRAFRKANADVNLVHAIDGAEALDYLYAKGRFEGAEFPHYMLLDLNMPRLDGREVLKAVRADSTVAHLPIIVMTTSDQPPDIMEAYMLGANAYMVKPPSYEEFQRIVKSLDDFWNHTAVLPKNVS